MIKKIGYVMMLSTLLAAPAVFTNGCAVAGNRESVGQYADDKSIETRLKTDLYNDPVVKGTQVQLNVLRGNVQLSGFVDNENQKMRAGQIAASIPGVQSVHNDLIVGAASGTISPTGR